MLSRIITGDETWFSHVTPESKQQSMERRHTLSCKGQGQTDFVPEQYHGILVFWDRHGVWLVDFMQRGNTINAVAYGQILRKLSRAIQNKRRGMLTEGIFYSMTMQGLTAQLRHELYWTLLAGEF
ncbi:hypothetical protein AVEN_260083-1 [Araneus ventricosus]|uniref:Mariner Mos1 transposase n=1 Tax=Araneus ventricosus TaxID=182803 RepID=A0A4Y2G516_ARAVE|nr:hypothetical protein AVEN_260083-1 [Araneus ventricosus]